MKKIKWIMIGILSLIVVYFGIYSIQNIILTKSYVEYNKGQGSDSFIRCNRDIFNPEFATVFWISNEGHIGFKKTNIFIETNKDWENSYTGGTTVKNTNFQNLLKMVKNDCYQFQKTFYQNDDNKLYWTWSKSIKETPEQIEKRKKRKEEIKRQIESGEIKKDTRTLEEVLKDIREREAKEEQENKN